MAIHPYEGSRGVRRYWLAGVGGAGALVVIGWASVSLLGGHSISAHQRTRSEAVRAARAQAHEPQARPEFGEAVGKEAVASAIAARAAEHAGSILRTEGEVAQLHNAVADVVGAYLSPSPDAWIAMCRQYGITVPDVYQEHPDYAAKLWENAWVLFADAHFADVAVVEGGQDISPAQGQVFSTGRRDDGRPFLGDLSWRDRHTIEVVLRGTFTDRLGKPFEGVLHIEFTHNPETEQWVPTQLRSVVPMDAAFPVIPF